MQPMADVYLGDDAVLVGRARFMLRRGQVTTSFTYDEAYLARPDAFAIDPALPLAGRVGFAAGLPGAFSDSAPDRWGRRLIRRASARVPDEVDYLLGVYDRTRQGALRFRIPGETAFCTEDAEVPPCCPAAEAPGGVPCGADGRGRRRRGQVPARCRFLNTGRYPSQGDGR